MSEKLDDTVRKKRGKKYCVAYGCNNIADETSRTAGISFHMFPISDHERCKKWEHAMHRQNFQASKWSIVCSTHFEPECFDRTGQKVRIRENSRNSNSGMTDEQPYYEDLDNLDDQLPSRMAKQWGTRTLSRGMHNRLSQKRYFEPNPDSQDFDDSSAIPMYDVTDSEDKNMNELMDDEDVRDRTISLAKKRKLRIDRLNKQSVTDSTPSWSSGFVKTSSKYKTLADEKWKSVKIFKKSLKQIEGGFGLSVLSYFYLIKWLLLVNIFTSIVVICFIVLPHATMQPKDFTRSRLCTNKSNADQFTIDACMLSVNYTNSIADRLTNATWTQNLSQRALDFFNGTGDFETSILFIGNYFNKDLPLNYRIDVSYLLTTALYFICILISMVVVSAKNVKYRMVAGQDRIDKVVTNRDRAEPWETIQMYANVGEKIFCSWDYSLWKESSAKFQHKIIFADFCNLIEDIKAEIKRKNATLWDKIKLWSIRSLLNVFIVSLLIGSGALIVVTVFYLQDLLKYPLVKGNEFLRLFCSFLPCFVITILNALMPVIFQKLVKYEKYSTETELHMNLIRTVFLRLASITVLVVTIGSQLMCDSPPCIAGVLCWETYFGQQIYKLALLDFVVVNLVILFVDFPRRFFVKKFSSSWLIKKWGQQEFDVSQNVIDITYTQTLCWIGMYFSPLIVVITVLKMFLFFYAKKWTLLSNCVPRQTRAASKTNYFFMIILMIAFLLCTSAIAFSVGKIQPSQSCGPFRVYLKENYRMFDALTNSISKLPFSFQNFLYFIGTWMFLITLLIALSLAILYYKSFAAGHRKMVRFLKDQLIARFPVIKLSQKKGGHAPLTSIGPDDWLDNNSNKV